MGIFEKIRSTAFAVSSYFMLPESLNNELEYGNKASTKTKRKVSLDELTESVIKGTTRERAGYSRRFWDFI
ncbi:MAG: hypothetical protein PUA61_10120 [Succinatimonas hippei]|nr:hypothetical protein [Succinatimonas hippei]